MERKILLLGNPLLYEKAVPVTDADTSELSAWIADLGDTLRAFRARHGVGRAIAAPQIGIPRRIIYQEIEGVHTVFINPEVTFPDAEMQQVTDDCMSFPGLLVRLSRCMRCDVRYLDQAMTPQTAALSGDLAELFQHEYDHLDGILATMRAEGPHALSFRGWDA